MYALLIRGGTLVDPAQGLHEPKDPAVERGRIYANRLPLTGRSGTPGQAGTR